MVRNPPQEALNPPPSILEDEARVLTSAANKQQRLRAWLAKQRMDGVIVSRRDNFAWLTSGGDNRVLNNTEIGYGHLLITADRQYLLAHSMDGRRLMEEQVNGQDYQLVELRWHQGDPRQKALELAGKRVAADTQLAGARESNVELSLLHFPLDELEIDRLRWLGGRSAEILEILASQVLPGMSEEQVARQMRASYALEGIDLDVLIVGCDERIFKYRHPLPTQKRLENYLLLHPAARRWGLHANISRSLYFGRAPIEIRRAYDAAATIEGRILATLQPGIKFASILQQQKDWYTELGFPGEWELHFQGGPTAYQVSDPTRCLTDTTVEQNQAFDWFSTVTGAKVEELSMITKAGSEILSLGNQWPLLEIWSENRRVAVPDLLELT